LIYINLIKTTVQVGLERAKDLQADADLAKAEAAQIQAKACLQAAISAVGVPVVCPPK